MKIKSILLTLLLSQNVFSTTVEEADKLYKKRGEKDINSYLAAQAYLKLAADETNTLEKAKLYNKSSRSFYYIGRIRKKLDFLEDGVSAAKKAYQLLISSNGVPAKEEYKKEAAEAYYQYSANLGKWGQIKGPIRSLFRWPELERHLNWSKAIDITVSDYGALRILGRAYIKVPGKSAIEGLNFQKTAYENTLVDVNLPNGQTIKVSRNLTTNLFLMENYIEAGQTAPFCELYDKFVQIYESSEGNDNVLNQMNADIVPEARLDFVDFDENKDLHEKYDEDC
ncbi:MAG: hypothetical protein H6622_09480 [Halobacteriovoraceae bacterium]|nr:hypothetical protein [Halobacteriovoraceae bacterium]